LVALLFTCFHIRVDTKTAVDAPQLVALRTFCREGNISEVTAWRWRRKGWLRTINISGRQYLSAESIADFKRRAAAGEFAQEHKTPRRESTAFK
jgi:hypothetical protein